MAVYIPMGHSSEKFNKPRAIVPDNCSLIIIETPGGVHFGDKVGEMYEYTRLRDFLKQNPDKKEIFSNPKENSELINEIFGSVAIFGPGEKYPNIDYSLFLVWLADIQRENIRGSKYSNVRYSGLIPLDNFLDPGFTTKNMMDKLFTTFNEPINIAENPYPLLRFRNENPLDIWVRNYSEIFKYSVFPSPNDFIKYFSTDETIKQILNESGNIDQTDKGVDELRTDAKILFDTSMFNNATEGYIRVSLETLMNKFPGHYIHITCRASETSTIKYVNRREWKYNPNTELEHTLEELSTKRIPFMSSNHKKRAIEQIQQSKLNKIKSPFSIRSSKNINNIMLSALKKSVMQNQLRSLKKVKGGKIVKRHTMKKRKVL
jgi:hypothetical protein